MSNHPTTLVSSSGTLHEAVPTVERRIRDLLADVYTPEGVEIWWRSPNRNPADCSPAERVAGAM